MTLEKMDLLPCPFCGGVATVIPLAINVAFGHGGQMGMTIKCTRCMCETPGCVDGARAGEVWNRRADREKAQQPDGSELVHELCALREDINEALTQGKFTHEQNSWLWVFLRRVEGTIKSARANEAADALEGKV